MGRSKREADKDNGAQHRCKLDSSVEWLTCQRMFSAQFSAMPEESSGQTFDGVR